MTTHPISPSGFQAVPQDIHAITETCRVYTEGWFTANADNVQRSLHPELIKRGIKFWQKSGKLDVGEILTAQAMVHWTREGGGSRAPESEKTFEITVLDVFRHMANVKVLSFPYMDYLFLAKIDDRWVVVMSLYEVRRGEELASDT